MPHRWKIEYLDISTGEITIKVETGEHMSTPKAVGFKMSIFKQHFILVILGSSLLHSWGTPG